MIEAANRAVAERYAQAWRDGDLAALRACYHPDFGSPMTFGAAPGIAYVVDASCTGFRLVR